MDEKTLIHWRQLIKKCLKEFSDIPFPDCLNLTSKTVFDENSDSYLVIIHGWQGVKRYHHAVADLEIKNEKIWIQLDGTPYGIAGELVEAGIPKDKIVLGFKSAQSRKYTEFAVD